MLKYTVLFEKSGNNWNAYVPDLPGCIAGGETRQEVEELIYEAIEMHIEDMLERGELIPEPSTDSMVMTIPAHLTLEQV